ncbi:hypothetical protein BST97_09665 [Nonlabens spongiae]|uniref:Uncharacterized protein n=1 Tax=Nonlabens spongiae TaxID=331648 RepID=A0A1W6ML50_9FLAO|nr:hypothetical protein [Nonlabens spongiae]ARN78236.1 hypothetical protein BST97_09665 [Nonlabens spongiae]
MVRIIGFKKREKEDGAPFFVLELQGGIEMVKSAETGQFYATAKKAFVTSTFDEMTCEALIGSEMEGSIVKKQVDPYTYVVKETGEEIILRHRWIYLPESSEEARQDEMLDQLMSNEPSSGLHELAEQDL